MDRDSQGIARSKGQACSGGSKAEASGHQAHGRPSVFLSSGYENKGPQMGWLTTKVVSQYTCQAIHCLWRLQLPRRWQGHAPSETCGRAPLWLLQASGGSLALPGAPWLVDASLTPILRLHTVFFLCLSSHARFLYGHQLHRTRGPPYSSRTPS